MYEPTTMELPELLLTPEDYTHFPHLLHGACQHHVMDQQLLHYEFNQGADGN